MVEEMGPGVFEVEDGLDEDVWVGTPTLLEGARPLSKSLLWRMHREYFERSGVEAWSQGEVPFSLTTGPILAQRYARVIEGFVADCLAGRLGAVDPSEPLYIIELGAGSGRLAFMIMQLMDHAAIEPMKVVYVLTDLAQSNVEFFAHRKELQRFAEQGRVDFARYEAGSDDPIHLEIAGIDLVPGNVTNPMVGISNYLFCAMPQDLYSVLGEELREEHVALFALDPSIKPNSREFLKQIVLCTAHAPVPEVRYDGGRIDRVLREAAKTRAGGKNRFVYPPYAIKSIESLLTLSGGRLCLLIGDRGPAQLPPVDDDEGPESQSSAYTPGELFSMGIHGSSISVPNDLDVISIAADDLGAELMRQPTPASQVVVAAILAGEQGEGSEARSEFNRVFGETSTDDLHLTVGRAVLAARGMDDASTLESIFATLRVSGYDPFTFVMLHPVLERLLPQAKEHQKDELERIVGRVYALNYPFEEVSDIAFGLASILAQAGRYEAALAHFAHSRADRGARAPVSYDSALCHLHLDQINEALALLDEALELDPEHERAKTLRDKVIAGERFDDEVEAQDVQVVPTSGTKTTGEGGFVRIRSPRTPN